MNLLGNREVSTSSTLTPNYSLSWMSSTSHILFYEDVELSSSNSVPPCNVSSLSWRKHPSPGTSCVLKKLRFYGDVYSKSSDFEICVKNTNACESFIYRLKWCHPWENRFFHEKSKICIEILNSPVWLNSTPAVNLVTAGRTRGALFKSCHFSLKLFEELTKRNVAFCKNFHPRRLFFMWKENLENLSQNEIDENAFSIRKEC